VEPAALFPELLGDRVDKGGGVVMEGGLDLGHALRRGWHGLFLERARGVRRHDPELGPGGGGG
jgi:hypothetical protein